MNIKVSSHGAQATASSIPVASGGQEIKQLPLTRIRPPPNRNSAVKDEGQTLISSPQACRVPPQPNGEAIAKAQLNELRQDMLSRFEAVDTTIQNLHLPSASYDEQISDVQKEFTHLLKVLRQDMLGRFESLVSTASGHEQRLDSMQAQVDVLGPKTSEASKTLEDLSAQQSSLQKRLERTEASLRPFYDNVVCLQRDIKEVTKLLTDICGQTDSLSTRLNREVCNWTDLLAHTGPFQQGIATTTDLLRADVDHLQQELQRLQVKEVKHDTDQSAFGRLTEQVSAYRRSIKEVQDGIETQKSRLNGLGKKFLDSKSTAQHELVTIRKRVDDAFPDIQRLSKQVEGLQIEMKSSIAKLEGASGSMAFRADRAPNLLQRHSESRQPVPVSTGHPHGSAVAASKETHSFDAVVNQGQGRPAEHVSPPSSEYNTLLARITRLNADIKANEGSPDDRRRF
ncbi:hypothetical protein P7C71_g3145, partial [Lecanoromycetidae sp. Uapishka_2]